MEDSLIALFVSLFIYGSGNGNAQKARITPPFKYLYFDTDQVIT